MIPKGKQNKKKSYKLDQIDEGREMRKNKVRYRAAPVAYGWAGAIFEVNRAFGQGQ